MSISSSSHCPLLPFHLLTQQIPGGQLSLRNLCFPHYSSLLTRRTPGPLHLLAPGILGLLCSFWGAPSSITSEAAPHPSLNCPEKMFHSFGHLSSHPAQIASIIAPLIQKSFLKAPHTHKANDLFFLVPMAIPTFSLQLCLNGPFRNRPVRSHLPLWVSGLVSQNT